MSIKVLETLQELVNGQIVSDIWGCFRHLDFFKKTFTLETVIKIDLLIIQPLQPIHHFAQFL